MIDEEKDMASVIGAKIIDFKEADISHGMYRVWNLVTTKGTLIIRAEDGGYIEKEQKP